MRLSAEQELDAVVRGFAGRYIAAGVGGDPLRTPEALPTGRNFASFDPRRIPDRSSYALGAKLADELIQSWRDKHGEYPDKLTFTLWGVETMRHQGVQESQIMALMGVQPVYDAAGVVRGVEAIPQQQLGRPRIDVTVIPSGLYRDLFSNVVSLLDQAVSVALEQDEPDNYVRYNMLQTREQLTQQGVDPALAARMAAVRLFSVPPGAYGTAIENIVDRSDSWDDEQQIADVYFMRMSHMYGQGFWGETVSDDADNAIGRQLLRSALSGTDMTIHARSSHVYQVLDGDDPFASFGGLSLAIRSVDGTTPPVMISNLADPGNSRQETLERFMGREMRSRYLNPEWISAMQEEGYAGAKFINDVVQNLWGWQVTVPDAVDAAKWNEIYETYIQDRYDLDIEEFFRDAGNLEALHALMSRMLEAVRKDYWQADADVIADLGDRVRALSEELLLACDNNQCDEPMLEKLVQADLVPAPGMPAAAAAGASLQGVQGYELVQVSRTLTSNQATTVSRLTPWLVFLILFGSFAWGYIRNVPD
ncbi:MAG TPA: cobaltochelatase subunit CobN [Pseudohongiella sp.]|nr:cobaltochelatase subunit CobN [Pseudohongiella sp.]